MFEDITMTTAKKRILTAVIIIFIVTAIWIAYDGYIPIKIEHEFTAEVYSIVDNGYEYIGDVPVLISGTRRIRPLRKDIFDGSFKLLDRTIETFEFGNRFEQLRYMNGSKIMNFGEIEQYTFDLSRFAVTVFKITESDANHISYKSDKLVLCEITLDEYLEAREELYLQYLKECEEQ